MKYFLISVFYFLVSTIKAQFYLDSIFLNTPIYSMSMDKDSLYSFVTGKGVFVKKKEDSIKLLFNSSKSTFNLLNIKDKLYFFTSRSLNSWELDKSKVIFNSFDNIQAPLFVKKVCKNIRNDIFVAANLDFIYKVSFNHNTIDTILYRVGHQNQINDIFCDNKQTIWVATNQGIYTLDKAYLYDEGIQFAPLKKINDFKMSIYSISQLNDTLYFGADNRIFQFNIKDNWLKPKSLCLNHLTAINQIAFDKEKRLWFLGEDKVGIFLNEKEQSYMRIESKTGIASKSTTCFLYNQHKNLFYVGTAGKGIFVFQDLLVLEATHKKCDTPIRDSDCGKLFSSGDKDKHEGHQLHYIGINQQFRIQWNMHDLKADKLLIYDGKDTKGKLLLDTGFQKGKGESHNYLYTESGYLTIEIKKKGTKTSGWNYRIECID